MIDTHMSDPLGYQSRYGDLLTIREGCVRCTCMIKIKGYRVVRLNFVV